MRDMARVLGHEDDVIKYEALRQNLTNAWSDAFWNESIRSYGASQTANALALYMNASGTNTSRDVLALEALVGDLEASSYALSTGALGARYVFQALGSRGRVDVVLRVLLRTDAPSLGYMVNEGPGTIWENWSGDRYDADGSKNHPMFCGGVGLYLYDLAGYATGDTTIEGADGLEHHLYVSSTLARLVGAARVRNRRVYSSWAITRDGAFEMNVTLDSEETPSSSDSVTETARVSLPRLTPSACHRIEEIVRGVVRYVGPCSGLHNAKMEGGQRRPWSFVDATPTNHAEILTGVQVTEPGRYAFQVRVVE